MDHRLAPHGVALYPARRPGRASLPWVKLVVQDHADDGATVETGGLLFVSDLLLEARRRYRAEVIRAGQIRSQTRFG